MKNGLQVVPLKDDSFEGTLRLFEQAFAIQPFGVQIYDAFGEAQYENEQFLRIQRYQQISHTWLTKCVFDVLRHRKDIHVTNDYSVVDITFSALPFGGVLVKMIEKEQCHISPEQMNQLQHHLWQATQLPSQLIATDAVMRGIKIWAKEMANSPVPIAISGATGSGKKHLARWIHAQRQHPVPTYFIEIDGARMTEAYIRSLCHTLLSLSKQEAQQYLAQSTLYIHRLDCLPFDLQEELLLLITHPNFQQYTRIIISLAQSLEESYANSVISECVYDMIEQAVTIPPLYARVADIDKLMSYFLKQKSQQRMSRLTIEQQAWALLKQYAWPCNVTELGQVVDKMAALDTSHITKEHVMAVLPAHFVQSLASEIQSLAEMEKKAIAQALQVFGATLDGKRKVAEVLNISLSTLYNKMKIYDL